MKKIAQYLLIALCGAAAVSCNLETTSPSVVDGEFVFGGIETAKPAILGAYDQITDLYNTNYIVNFTCIGSDVERCSVGNITDLVGGAQLYLEPYDEARFNINFQKGVWDKFYSVIFKCNSIIENIEANSDFDNIVKTAPNDLSDLLGQAYALRATMYYDMTVYYGDVIYITEPRQDIKELSSRFAILESELENLKRVEPYLYTIGSNGHLSDQMTRNYVDGLIGRICFSLAGYHTRRTDLGADFYVDKDGKPISFDDWGTDTEKNAAYGRRSDWKSFYTTALPFLQKAVDQPGAASLTTTDPRGGDGRTYGNPFQYYFQLLNENYKAPETIYEVTMRQTGGKSRVAYNFGRGSQGGSPAMPPKANSQVTTYPEVYYGEFDPQDMRRDASMTVTGSSGTGVEIIDGFILKNRNNGGIGMNKYDPNRVDLPDLRQMYAGISWVVLRQADILLMLAEAYAQTGDEGNARTYLKQVHDRAFPDAVQDTKFAELLASEGSMLDAIIKERQLEFVGENIRRWDLVRTGKLPQVAYEFRKKMVDHMAELKTKGYATFDNGNELPAYIWTKLVDAKSEYGYRLTMQTPEGMEDDPVLYPGWRGQHDDWQKAKDYQLSSGRSAKVNGTVVEGKTNLAIKGLFKHIEPGSAEAQALEAEGYEQTHWAIGMYQLYDKDKGWQDQPDQEAEWSTKFLGGYTDADYAAKKAPIYLIPMEQNVLATTGLTNGYGFQNPK